MSVWFTVLLVGGVVMVVIGLVAVVAVERARRRRDGP